MTSHVEVKSLRISRNKSQDILLNMFLSSISPPSLRGKVVSEKQNMYFDDHYWTTTNRQHCCYNVPASWPWNQLYSASNDDKFIRMCTTDTRSIFRWHSTESHQSHDSILERIKTHKTLIIWTWTWMTPFLGCSFII